MLTRRVGKVEIDQQRLAADLKCARGFVFSEAYSEYVCGGPWKSCVLWAVGGESGDGLVTNYDYTRRSTPTEYGAQLSYLSQLIERCFRLDYLTFARLAIISNSVIIPHRDLLELRDIPEHARNAHRVHIPLVTNDACFFLHADVVYQMRAGEIWFFDAAAPHSAASFADEDRIHLMLDFAHVQDEGQLLRFPADSNSDIPQESIRVRAPMMDDERHALLALARIIDMDNWREVMAILIKQHYRIHGGDNFIWDTFLRIAEASGKPGVRDKANALHRYFLIERAAEPARRSWNGHADHQRDARVATEYA